MVLTLLQLLIHNQSHSDTYCMVKSMTTMQPGKILQWIPSPQSSCFSLTCSGFYYSRCQTDIIEYIQTATHLLVNSSIHFSTRNSSSSPNPPDSIYRLNHLTVRKHKWFQEGKKQQETHKNLLVCIFTFLTTTNLDLFKINHYSLCKSVLRHLERATIKHWLCEWGLV